MNRVVRLLAVATTSILVNVGQLEAQQTTAYPETRKVAHVDNYHGTEVPDPYRWLEDDVRTSQDVADWVEAQNKVTFAYLESIPDRERIRRRLTELWDYEKFGSPFKAGGRYYYLHNSGLQNQFVLFVTESVVSRRYGRAGGHGLQ